MHVSRARLHRGLLIAQGLVSGALKRKWEVEAYEGSAYGDRAGVAIFVHEHRYPMEVHEETRALPFTWAEIAKWRNESLWTRTRRASKSPPAQLKRKEPTGKLRLVLPHGYRGGRASWTDSARSLNDRLDSVFTVLE